MPDLEPLVGRVDEAAIAGRRGLQEGQGRRPQGVASGLDDVIQPDAPILEALRVDLDLKLPIPLSPDRNVRDARNAQQAGPNIPAGEDRKLDEGELLRGE